MKESTEISTLVATEQLTSYLTAMGLANNLNEKEKTQFIEISKAFNLNPFKREIYCTKYGDNFSIIVGYESYIKRAERTGQLNGWSATTEGSTQSGNLRAIITIHRKDFIHPFIHEVYYSEYVQKTRDGNITKFWKDKPITMIKKVGISQAFRMCFSSEIGGMPYTAEEIIENETAYTEITEIKDSKPAIEKIKQCKTLDELQLVWKENKEFQKDVDFINAKNTKKKELQAENIEVSKPLLTEEQLNEAIENAKLGFPNVFEELQQNFELTEEQKETFIHSINTK